MKIQIVNNQDEVIGVKERSEMDYGQDIYRVSALWLTNSKGEVLLAKRTMTKDKDPGRWGVAAAGTLDEGETYDSNIYKEIEEEIGLTDVTLEKGQKMFVTEPRSSFIQLYTATLDREPSAFTLQAEEVDEVAWFSVGQIKQELKDNPEKYVPAMSQIIRELGI